jgi:hypothetical protein
VGFDSESSRIFESSDERVRQFGAMDTYERIELLLKWCLRETCGAGKACLRTNYHGTKQIIGALLPLLLAFFWNVICPKNASFQKKIV